MISGDVIEEISRYAGITRIAEITGLDFVGIPVISVMRPAARSLSVASGKGATREAAIASGFFEALEMAAAEWPSLEIRRASREAWRNDARFLDPDLLPRDARAARRSDAAERKDLRWVTGRRLAGGAEVFVPFDLVHLDLTVAGLGESDGLLVSTNGLAAGLTREAALLHGLSEVVERDAIALASGPQGEIALETLPRLDLETVDEPVVAGLLEKCRSAGLLVGCWEVTSEIAVPSFYCRVVEGERAPFRLAVPADGSGADPDPAIALRRALTEALQSRLTLISGARDDILRRYYNRSGGNLDAVLPAGKGARSLAEIRGLKGADPAIRLSWVLARLAEAGFCGAAAVDLSPPGLKLAVVRVVVPGLEGMTLSRGYLPGRRALKAWRASWESAREAFP